VSGAHIQKCVPEPAFRRNADAGESIYQQGLLTRTGFSSALSPSMSLDVMVRPTL
jgi:hypothetical protein